MIIIVIEKKSCNKDIYLNNVDKLLFFELQI